MERLTDMELQMALELSGEHSTMRRIAEECMTHRKERAAAIKLITAYRDDLAGRTALEAVTPGRRQWIADQIAACNRLLGATS